MDTVLAVAGLASFLFDGRVLAKLAQGAKCAAERMMIFHKELGGCGQHSRKARAPLQIYNGFASVRSKIRTSGERRVTGVQRHNSGQHSKKQLV